MLFININAFGPLEKQTDKNKNSNIMYQLQYYLKKNATIYRMKNQLCVSFC